MIILKNSNSSEWFHILPVYIFVRKERMKLGMVVDAYNSSTPGGRHRRMSSSRST
jgi:hypothetical protein